MEECTEQDALDTEERERQLPHNNGLTLNGFLRNGNLQKAQEILTQVCDVNAPDGSDGKTPLMVASQKGFEELCETLLQKGADLNAQDKDGKTPLMYACEKGLLKLVVKWANMKAEEAWTSSEKLLSLFSVFLSVAQI